MMPQIVRDHWISLDECPVCKSDLTFHSEWMKNNELQTKCASNAFRIDISKSIESLDKTKEEVVYTKSDLCLSCGHTWVMYIGHYIVDKKEQIQNTQ